MSHIDPDRILNTAAEISSATGAKITLIDAIRKYSRLRPDDSPFTCNFKLTTKRKFMEWLFTHPDFCPSALLKQKQFELSANSDHA